MNQSCLYYYLRFTYYFIETMRALFMRRVATQDIVGYFFY